MAADAPPPVSTASAFVSVQVLRGVAAFLVVLCHSGHATRLFPTGETSQVLRVLAASLDFGVDLFFAISGFVMMLALSAPRPPAAGDFLLRRVARVYPAYWLFTGIMILAALSARNAGAEVAVTLDAGRIATSLLLLPADGPPILTPGWTLRVELVFYVLVALILAAGLARHALAIVAGLSILALLQAVTGTSLAHGLLLPAYMAEFAAGMAVCAMRHRLAAGHPPRLAGGGLVLFLAAQPVLAAFPVDAFGTALRVALLGPAAALLLAAAVGAEARMGGHAMRALAMLGDASYTLYLSHWFLLSAMGDLAGRTGAAEAVPVLVWLALAVLVAVLFALAFARTVEAPLQRRLRAALRPRRPVAASLSQAR